MNIKQSIEWLNLKRKCDDRVFPDSIIERHQRINDIIGILENIEENEKYKKMWYETRDKFAYIEQMNFPIHRYTYENIMSVMNEIKQKHFSETVKKYVTIEVESEKESEVDDGISDIKELVDNMGCPKMKIANSWVEVDKK